MGLSVFGQDRLLAGAIIADQVRASVRNELSYTCSVVSCICPL